MGVNNGDSNYGSKLEKYLEEQDNSSDDLDLDDESNFQTFNKGFSKLDDYIGFDDEEDEDEEIRHCSVCGKELKKFNYGDKCDDCVKKIELVQALNQLLDYVNPSEELKSDQLLFSGFDELELNILISNLTEEHLIVLGSNGIFLADVKTLNNFFKVYGSSSDLLDESLYKNVMFSDNFVDISKYSDLVKVVFNPKNNKWAVTLLRDNKFVLKKFFATIFDANNFATRYLKEMGELDNLQERKPIKQEEKAKYRRSEHEHIYFSPKRNQWFVKFVSHIRSKIVGFYDTEEEAVIARDNYIRKKREHQAKIKRTKFVKDESDAIISFHERSDQWVVKVKTKKGRFKRLGYFDTEEEAIDAKNEYYGINVEPELNDEFMFSEEDDSVVTNDENYGIVEEPKLDDSPMFHEGDAVQIIGGPLKSNLGIIMRYDSKRDAYLVKFDNGVSIPMLIKPDLLKLI